MNTKPILCLDFDGVCSMATSGWQGADVIPDPPVPGLFEALEEYTRHFEVHIFSSRTNQPGGLVAMQQWFSHHWILWVEQLVYSPAKPPRHLFLHLLHFPTEKPPAMVGLDDRVITFCGCWPTAAMLRNFKPWHAQSTSPDNTSEQANKPETNPRSIHEINQANFD